MKLGTNSVKLISDEMQSLWFFLQKRVLATIVTVQRLNAIVEISESIVIGDNQEWEVEKILNFCLYRKKLQYQVKWIEFDDDTTWYPVSDFKDSSHCDGLVTCIHLTWWRGYMPRQHTGGVSFSSSFLMLIILVDSYLGRTRHVKPARENRPNPTQPRLRWVGLA